MKARSDLTLQDEINLFFGLQIKDKNAEVNKRRTKEKYEFRKRFRYDFIWDIYKKRFFTLFNNKCFNCGTMQDLLIDHHIPLILGGQTIPGNLVVLCKTCNGIKRDRPPSDFYTLEKTNILKSFLDKQHDLFDFRFNWQKWNDDPQKYLVEIGLDAALVYEMFNNTDHPSYMKLEKTTIIEIKFPKNNRKQEA